MDVESNQQGFADRSRSNLICINQEVKTMSETRATTPQVTAKHYQQPIYRQKERFASYWYQIHEIELTNCSSVLEIGVGNGFMSRELKHTINVNVIGLDIDCALDPNVAADVRSQPFKDNSFEVVAAFQVLEHLPYNDFEHILSELKRISRQYILLSLPDRSPFYFIQFSLPLIGRIDWSWTRNITYGEKSDNPSHYWEIGLNHYSYNRIVESIHACGLTIVRTFRPIENPYHRFLTLKI